MYVRTTMINLSAYMITCKTQFPVQLIILCIKISLCIKGKVIKCKSIHENQGKVVWFGQEPTDSREFACALEFLKMKAIPWRFLSITISFTQGS